MNWIANLTGGYSSSAKIVDGTLILSLPDAVSPVVWRMDLGQAKASALEIREKKNGTFMLTLKTPKGDVNEIAPFDERARALRALMAVSRAMEQAHGQTIRFQPAPGSAQRATANNGNNAQSDGAALASNTEQAPATLHSPQPPYNGPAYPAPRRGGNIAASVIGIVILLIMVYGLIAMGPRSQAGLDAANLAGVDSSRAPASGEQATGTPVSADDFLRNR